MRHTSAARITRPSGSLARSADRRISIDRPFRILCRDAQIGMLDSDLMDALSEMLRVIRLDSAIYFNAEFCEPWCLASPDSNMLAPMLAPAGAHVIIYHLLCEGRAYVELQEGERVPLTAGDLVAVPHGHRHVLGSGARVPAIDAGAALPDVLQRGLEPVHYGGDGAASRFICGFLACDPQLSQAFLGGLPPLIRVNVRDDASGQWLENSLKFSVVQAMNREPGAGAMLAKLSEVAFAETLRRYVRELPDGQTGWLAGARDPDVGKALTLIHHRHAHPWTLSELAKEAGVSRTVLATRFRHFLGEPPIAYLTRWRLRLGARALLATSHSVAQIASAAGYESEAAFNRAFKREFGLPPARYRKNKASRRDNR
jgi:AraC-like DNA-binding protein